MSTSDFALFERLEGFLADLRAGGIAIGPEEQGRVLRVLTHFATHDALGDPARVCNSLAAIVCTSREQREAFERRFGQWFAAWVQLGAPGRVAGDDGPISRAGSRTTWHESSAEPALAGGVPVAWGALVLALVLAMLGPRASHFFAERGVGAGPAASAPVQSRGRGAAGATQGPGFNRDAARLGAPSASAAVGVGPPPSEAVQVPESAAKGAAPGGGLGPGLVRFEGRPSKALLGAAAVFALAILAIGLERRRMLLKEGWMEPKPAFREVLLEAKTGSPLAGHGIVRAAQALRSQRKASSLQLDIVRTIESTVAAAGVFEPRYAPRRVTPEYLVLVDRRGASDHLVSYFQDLLEHFRTAGVFLDVYYFHEDPRRCARGPGHAAATLAELCAWHPDHRLLLLADAACLLDPSTGRPFRWTSDLAAWDTRALLSPHDPREWGHAERIVEAELGLAAFSANREGVVALGRAMTGDQGDLSPRPQAAKAGLRGLLADRPWRWTDASAPAPDVLDNFICGLQRNLRPAAFDWLAAAAVFPGLSAPLTVYLGENLRGSGRAPLFSPPRALALARLPWFRSGHMPEWLRARLLRSLTPERRREVRDVIDTLLTSPGRRRPDIELHIADGDAGAELLEPLRLGDQLLLEFLRSRRFEGPAYELAARVAQALGMPRSASLRRDLIAAFAGGDMLEAIERVAGEISGQPIVGVARLWDDQVRSDLGPEFCRCSGYLSLAGDLHAFEENLFVYREDDNAHEMDEFEAWVVAPAAAFRLVARRRLVFLLAVASLLIMAVLVSAFGGDLLKTMHPTLAIWGCVLALWGPGFLFHFALVPPVRAILRRFPRVKALAPTQFKVE